MEKINVNKLENTYSLKPKTIYNFKDTTINIPTTLVNLFNLEAGLNQEDKHDIITIENLTIAKDVKLFTDNNLKYIRFINCNISGFSGELANSTSLDTIMFKNCLISTNDTSSTEYLFNFTLVLKFTAINCFFSKGTGNFNLLPNYTNINFTIVTSTIGFTNNITSATTKFIYLTNLADAITGYTRIQITTANVFRLDLVNKKYYSKETSLTIDSTNYSTYDVQIFNNLVFDGFDINITSLSPSENKLLYLVNEFYNYFTLEIKKELVFFNLTITNDELKINNTASDGIVHTEKIILKGKYVFRDDSNIVNTLESNYIVIILSSTDTVVLNSNAEVQRLGSGFKIGTFFENKNPLIIKGFSNLFLGDSSNRNSIGLINQGSTHSRIYFEPPVDKLYFNQSVRSSDNVTFNQITLADDKKINLGTSKLYHDSIKNKLIIDGDIELIGGTGSTITTTLGNLILNPNGIIECSKGIEVNNISTTSDLNLSIKSGCDINIPSDIGLTFGNDGEKIEGNGTDLTISGGIININSESSIKINGGYFGTSTGTGIELTSGNISLDGNIVADGSITASSFISGSVTIETIDLGKIQGITDGTASANKSLVVDGSKDLQGINNLSISGTFSDGTASLSGGILSSIKSATIKSTTPILTIESTTYGGPSVLYLIADKNDGTEDAFEIKLLNEKLTISSDYTTRNNFTDTFLTLSNEIDGTRTTVSGNLVVTGNVSGTWNGTAITSGQLDFSTFNSAHFEINTSGKFSIKGIMLTGADTNNFLTTGNILSFKDIVTIKKLIVGDGTNDSFIEPNGDYNLIIKSGSSSASQASIKIGKGNNGNITLTGNGTGYIDCKSDISISKIKSDDNVNIEIAPGGSGIVKFNSNIEINTISSTGDINLSPYIGKEIITSGHINLFKNTSQLKLGSSNLLIYNSTHYSAMANFLSFKNINTSNDVYISLDTNNLDRKLSLYSAEVKFTGDNMEFKKTNDYYHFDSDKFRCLNIIGSTSSEGDLTLDSTTNNTKGKINLNSDSLLVSTNKLMFRDDNIHISSVSDGSLTIQSDSSINLNISNSNKITVNNTNVTFTNNLIIPDDGIIGSSSDNDAIKISSTGIITFSCATNSTTSSNGALVVAGGVGIDKDVNLNGNISLLSDSSQINFGSDKEVLIKHDNNIGLIFQKTTTTDNNPFILTLASNESNIQTNDVISTLNFQSLGDSSGSTAVKISAGITAIAEENFSSTSNKTRLVFKTAVNNDAVENMSLSSNGNLTITGSLTLDTTEFTATELSILKGSTSASTGVTIVNDDQFILNDNGTMKQITASVLDSYISNTTNILSNKTLASPIITGSLTLGGTILSATTEELNYLDITTLGTSENSKVLTQSSGGTVNMTGNLVFSEGKNITLTGSSNDLITLSGGTNGSLTIETNDSSGSQADIDIIADGTFTISGTTITLNSGGNIILDADGGEFIFSDNSTNILKITNTSIELNGNQILTAQQTSETDVTLTSTQQTPNFSDLATVTTAYNKAQADISALKTTLNSLLAKLRTHGLIAT